MVICNGRKELKYLLGSEWLLWVRNCTMTRINEPIRLLNYRLTNLILHLQISLSHYRFYKFFTNKLYKSTSNITPPDNLITPTSFLQVL